jgi:hypothetical protein
MVAFVALLVVHVSVVEPPCVTLVGEAWISHCGTGDGGVTGGTYGGGVDGTTGGVVTGGGGGGVVTTGGGVVSQQGGVVSMTGGGSTGGGGGGTTTTGGGVVTQQGGVTTMALARSGAVMPVASAKDAPTERTATTANRPVRTGFCFASETC